MVLNLRETEFRLYLNLHINEKLCIQSQKKFLCECELTGGQATNIGTVELKPRQTLFVRYQFLTHSQLWPNSIANSCII